MHQLVIPPRLPRLKLLGHLGSGRCLIFLERLDATPLLVDDDVAVLQLTFLAFQLAVLLVHKNLQPLGRQVAGLRM